MAHSRPPLEKRYVSISIAKGILTLRLSSQRAESIVHSPECSGNQRPAELGRNPDIRSVEVAHK